MTYSNASLEITVNWEAKKFAR